MICAMKKGFRFPTQDEQGILIVLTAIIAGAWTRLIVPLEAGFPVNDGGMFYIIIQSIQANGYALPSYFHYNGLTIPFAYPPLGLFVGAWLTGLLNIDPLRIIQWLPAIVSIPTIIVFYPLARRILNQSLSAGIATLIFALTPRVITWQVMGGGLTRSFGLLFFIPAIYYVYQLFTERSLKHLLLAILFNALVILSHPETTLHAIGFGLILWLFKGRNKRGTMDAAIMVIGIILITSPWLITILGRFGLEPVLSAVRTGSFSPLDSFNGLFIIFSEEPLLQLVGVLAVIGIAVRLAKRDYLLPVLLLFPFIVEARTAETVSTIPLALLSTTGLCEAIFPIITKIEEATTKGKYTSPLQPWSNKILFSYLAIYFLINMFVADAGLWQVRVSDAAQIAFDWIKYNTVQNSRFLVLTGDLEPLCDPLQEWFPALTQRVSDTTIQGREWLGVNQFTNYTENAQAIQGCLAADNPLSCIKDKTARAHLQYDYLLIARKGSIKSTCRVLVSDLRGDALIASLKKQSDYRTVYQTNDIVIFQVTKTYR